MEKHIIRPQELIGSHTKILRKSPESPKALVAYINVQEQNGQLRATFGFVVFDNFGKQVFKSDHISLAVKEYNKI